MFLLLFLLFLPNLTKPMDKGGYQMVGGSENENGDVDFDEEAALENPMNYGAIPDGPLVDSNGTVSTPGLKAGASSM
jgi:hypothetical protein